MEFKPFRRRTSPSPLMRKVAKGMQIFTLCILGSFLLWRSLLYYDVKRQFAQMRGYPISGAELDVWRATVPDVDNGALVLTQAFALIRTFSDSRSNQVVEPTLLRRTNEWHPATKVLVREYTAMNSSALDRVRTAFRFSRFRYPVDFAFGPETPLPHLGSLKELARIAALKGALEAEEGRLEQWPEDVLLQLKLAQGLDDEPVIISHLVRSSIVRQAVRDTERCLKFGSPSKENCKLVQEKFLQVAGTNLLPMALVGERALAIPIFRLSWKEIQARSSDSTNESMPQSPQRYSGRPMSFLWLTGFFERDLNFFLQTMQRTTTLAALPFPQSLVLTNSLDSAAKLAERRGYIYSSMLLPSFSRVIVREASTRALAELAATAMALEGFRHEHGHLPTSLAELKPEFLDSVPIDPFDGAPIKYKQLPTGYIIYSVDADGRDDGGRERPEQRKSTDTTSYDLTFTVER